jgi:hypothetical protein
MSNSLRKAVKLNGTARTMLALRSAAALSNMRIQCVRVLATPRPLTPARAFWQQATVRPGPSYHRPRAEWPTTCGTSPLPIFPHSCLPPRSGPPHPWRLFRHLAAQDAKSAPQPSTSTAAAAAGVNESPQPTPTPSKATISNAEQRRRDWSIVRRLLVHIWPKEDWGTRGRVVLGVGLLICGKVRLSLLPTPIFERSSLKHIFVLQLLNVQVPLFFKEIIDTLNIPIGGQSTVWVVCGSVILACMWTLYFLYVAA